MRPGYKKMVIFTRSSGGALMFDLKVIVLHLPGRIAVFRTKRMGCMEEIVFP